MKTLSQISRDLGRPTSQLVSACNRLSLFTERLGEHRNATRLVTPEQEAKLVAHFARPEPVRKQSLTLSFHRPAVTKLGDPRANFVSGLHVNKAVLFQPKTRQEVIRLHEELRQQGTVKLFSDPKAETVNDCVGGVSNFKIADSQIIGDIDLLETNPLSQKIAAAIQRDPASVSFEMTEGRDGIVVSILTGTALKAKGISLLHFAKMNPTDYNAARKAGRI